MKKIFHKRVLWYYTPPHVFNINFSRINRAICYTRILHVRQRCRKQARTKSPLESLCRSSVHFDAIYEALLHADPITSILWYGPIIEIYKRLKVMPIDRAWLFNMPLLPSAARRRNSSIAGKIRVYKLCSEIFHQFIVDPFFFTSH